MDTMRLHMHAHQTCSDATTTTTATTTTRYPRSPDCRRPSGAVFSGPAPAPSPFPSTDPATPAGALAAQAVSMRAATFATQASVGSYVGERGGVELTPATSTSTASAAFFGFPAPFFVATASCTAAFSGLFFPVPFLIFLTFSAFLGACPPTLLSLHTCACVPPFFGMLPEPKKILFLYGTKL
jgi:hypothetical protein